MLLIPNDIHALRANKTWFMHKVMDKYCRGLRSTFFFFFGKHNCCINNKIEMDNKIEFHRMDGLQFYL